MVCILDYGGIPFFISLTRSKWHTIRANEKDLKTLKKEGNNEESNQVKSQSIAKILYPR